MRRTFCLLTIVFVVSACSLSAQRIDWNKQVGQGPYSQLDPAPYDPESEPDIDLFISHWQESMPRRSHGGLVKRDIFTACEGDPLNPERRGAVLTDLGGLSFATLSAHSSTSPAILSGKQEILYVVSGQGRIDTPGKTARIQNGIAILMPPGIEFTLTNMGPDPLQMFSIVEPVPVDFEPKTDMVVKDENTIPISYTTGHWAHIAKTLFQREDGLGVLIGMNPVWLDPMTMSQPHSHPPGVEEVWFVVEGEIGLLLGKELRRLAPGSAYKIPPDGETPHATINMTDKPIKLVWMMKIIE